MKYPKRVEKYKKECLKNFAEQNLFKAMNKLNKKARRSGVWTKRMMKRYDDIDAKVVKIMLKAEENCVQKFRFDTPWSKKLITASRAVHYWNLKASTYKGKRITEIVLIAALKTAELKDYTTTEEETKTE